MRRTLTPIVSLPGYRGDARLLTAERHSDRSEQPRNSQMTLRSRPTQTETGWGTSTGSPTETSPDKDGDLDNRDGGPSQLRMGDSARDGVTVQRGCFPDDPGRTKASLNNLGNRSPVRARIDGGMGVPCSEQFRNHPTKSLDSTYCDCFNHGSERFRRFPRGPNRGSLRSEVQSSGSSLENEKTRRGREALYTSGLGILRRMQIGRLPRYSAFREILNRLGRLARERGDYQRGREASYTRL